MGTSNRQPNRVIGSSLKATKDEFALTLWLFIGRCDDLTDAGSRQDRNTETREFVTNLLEFHLSLINELEKQPGPATIEPRKALLRA